MTCVTLSTCIPRAATSVATNTDALPLLNLARARCRWEWLLFPCMDSALIPFCDNCFESFSTLCFIAPKTRSHPDYLNLLKPVFDKFKNDKYLMVEFHFFAAGPSRTSRYLTWTTWTPEERQKIISKFKIALDFQKQTWRRIWFGAWMPGNYNHTYDKWNNYFSPEEQIKFSTFMISQMCKNHIPNAINGDTQFYDYKNNTWKWTKKAVLDKIVNYWKKYCW